MQPMTTICYLATSAFYFGSCLCTVRAQFVGAQAKRFGLRCTLCLLVAALQVACAAAVELSGGDIPLNYVCSLMLGCFAYYFVLRLDPWVIAAANLTLQYYVLCMFCLCTGAASLLLKKNMYQILTDPASGLPLRTLVMALAFVLVSIAMPRYHRRLQRGVNTSVYPTQVLLHFLLSLFLMYNCFNLYFNLDLVWLSMLQALMGPIMLGIYHLIIHFQQQERLHQETLARRRQNEQAILLEKSSFASLMAAPPVEPDVLHVALKGLLPGDVPEAVRALLANRFVQLHEEDILLCGSLPLPPDLPVSAGFLHLVLASLLESAAGSARLCDTPRQIRVGCVHKDAALCLTVEAPRPADSIYPAKNSELLSAFSLDWLARQLALHDDCLKITVTAMTVSFSAALFDN